MARAPIHVSNRGAFFYRASEMAEITGNEQTLAVWWNPILGWSRSFGWVNLSAHFDGVVMAELSPKARVASEMNPPRILLSEMRVDLDLGKHHRLIAGLTRPLTWHFPLECLAVPVVFSLGVLPDGRYLPHAVVTGWRDVPLAYAGAIDWYDIGLLWRAQAEYFRFSLGYVNGSQGLDANSSPCASFELRFGKDEICGGIAGQFGESGSVPVKEWRHQVQVFFQAGKRQRFGFEAMLHLGGVRNTNALVAGNNLLGQFGYSGNPFGPFSTVNDEQHANLLGIDPVFVPAFHAMLWFDLKLGQDDRLGMSGHFSAWDPDVMSEGSDEKKWKWRAFLRASWRLLPPLRLFASYTYTYDPVFLNPLRNQFFDREPRDTHLLVPHDILFGMAMDF